MECRNRLEVRHRLVLVTPYDTPLLPINLCGAVLLWLIPVWFKSLQPERSISG